MLGAAVVGVILGLPTVTVGPEVVGMPLVGLATIVGALLGPPVGPPVGRAVPVWGHS